MGLADMARRPRGETPHYVDLHVGRRIRLRRKAARLSMEALAAVLGVTHQQLQKYETGVNRMTASTLYEIAGALETTVESLFEGLPRPSAVAVLDSRGSERLERFLSSPGGAELMAAFVELPEHLQQPLVAMARASAAACEPAVHAASRVQGRTAV